MGNLVNPFGKLGLDNTLQRIAGYLQAMASTIGQMFPDANGRMRVNVELGTITTVTTITTLTNQTQQSGYSTAYDQYAQMQLGEAGLRSQIKVT